MRNMCGTKVNYIMPRHLTSDAHEWINKSQEKKLGTEGFLR